MPKKQVLPDYETDQMMELIRQHNETNAGTSQSCS